jgi:hypothetical protein
MEGRPDLANYGEGDENMIGCCLCGVSIEP